MTYFLPAEQATTAGCVSSQMLAWLSFRANSPLGPEHPLVVVDSTAPQGGRRNGTRQRAVAATLPFPSCLA